VSDLAAALQVAIKTHAGQLDKQGAPYLLHVLRVVEAVSDEAKVVAALHDVIEDGPSDVQWENYCGSLLTNDEYEALTFLTRMGGETYDEYIAEIAEASNALAREVKLADLRDNLGRIPGPAEYNRKMHDERAHVMSYWPDYDVAWGSLRRRYEKAIDTLTAAVPVATP